MIALYMAAGLVALWLAFELTQAVRCLRHPERAPVRAPVPPRR